MGTKYDAFGREISEESAPQLTDAPRRGRRPGLVIALAALLLLGGLGAGLFLAVGAVDEAVDDPPTRPDLTETPVAAEATAEPTPAEPAATPRRARPARPAAPPRGLGQRSLIRPAAFGRVLDRIRRERLGDVRLLRVAAERIDATLLTGGGRMRHVQFLYTGELRRLATTGGGFGQLGAIPVSEVDRGAPARLARSAAARLGRGTSRIGYLALLDIGGQSWNVYFDDGAQFQAGRDGRIVRRVN